MNNPTVAFQSTTMADGIAAIIKKARRTAKFQELVALEGIAETERKLAASIRGELVRMQSKEA